MRKHLLLLVICVFVSVAAKAATYTVKVGSKITLRCTATAPAGTITHAVFEIADLDDNKYLGMTEYDTKGQTATFVGLEAKANVKVKVTYYYSYRGSYSGRMEVGHGTYTETVTVQGGAAATDINISPSSINMKVGETVTAKVVLTPANAVSQYEYGRIESLGSPPSYFDWSFNDGVFTITAKKAGSLYLVAQVSEKIVGTCVIRATKDGAGNVAPTDITLSSKRNTIAVGEQTTVNISLMPKGASSEIQWSTSDEGVATVSSKGVVTARKEGTAQITATASNGVSNTINFTVVPKAESISLPRKVSVALGFVYSLEPIVTPSNANAECTWVSSDPKVASVSAAGRVEGYTDGNVTVTVKTKDGLNSSTEVSVVRPEGIDAANASVRVSEIDAAANRVLLNIK